jgi:hypothetical protein
LQKIYKYQAELKRFRLILFIFADYEYDKFDKKGHRLGYGAAIADWLCQG